MVLIASSPFFLALLKRNKHTHPLVYMRGVRFEDLVAMVDFFYHGEANVFQENLESFLALAEELLLKGLMGNQTEDIPKMTEKAKVAKTLKNGRKDIISSEKVASMPQTAEKNSFETTVAVADQAVDLEKLDEEVKSKMAFSQNDAPGKAKGRAKICKVCGKEGTFTMIINHIEANHINAHYISCTLCGNGFRTRNAMHIHKS